MKPIVSIKTKADFVFTLDHNGNAVPFYAVAIQKPRERDGKRYWNVHHDTGCFAFWAKTNAEVQKKVAAMF